MNQPIKISLPKNVCLRDIIKDKYKYLYNEWKRKNNGSNNYTIEQLNKNIASAYSVIKMTFPESAFRKSRYNPWAEKGWYELPYSHWYFAVVFIRDKNTNDIWASIQDAHYEGDHHNYILHTQPYVDESYRRIMSLMERLENLYKKPPMI